MTRATNAPVLDMALEPKAEAAALTVPTGDPQMQLLQMMERMASNKEVDVVKMQAFIDMSKDVMQINARAAFNTAFARLQADIPTVIEKGKGDKGMSYARLEDIIESVRPVLQRHGFSLSHQTEWPDKITIKVIGILTHEAGHERRSEFVASADQTGSKNAIQALGSSNSYGRRYTTKDLLNIVTKEEDDDGKRAGAPPAPEGYDKWLAHVEALIKKGATSEELNAAWATSDEPFRTYLTKYDRSRYEGWKNTAKAAKRA